MKRTGWAAGLLAAAAALAVPAPTRAQVPGDVFGGTDPRDPRGARDGDVDAYRIGYDKGFEDGQKRGAKGDGRDLIHEPKYRMGDAGYKKSYGPRQDYITGYRDGYEQAYRRGYRKGREAGRDDPYGYGRDDRWRRDRDGRDERHEPPGRGADDDYDDDMVYEEPPGRR
jgi:hypothetical protein